MGYSQRGSTGIWDSTPDYASLNGCVGAATSGNTIYVSAGSAAWGSSTLNITKPMHIIGAGIGQTIVTGSSTVINITPSNYAIDNDIRLSGISFTGGSPAFSVGSPPAAPFGLQTKLRIDHCAITGAGGSRSCIWFRGGMYGVVDNCSITGGFPIGFTLDCDYDAWWSVSPQNIYTPGSKYYIYFEDNVFNGINDLVSDGYRSHRYVFRYNTFVCTGSSQMFDFHGEQSDGGAAGFGAELYGNLCAGSATPYEFFSQRSGQAWVFGNSTSSSGAPYGNGMASNSICPTNYATLKCIHNTYWWANRANRTGTLWGYGVSGTLSSCAGRSNIPTMGRDVITDSSSPAVTSGTLANRPATPAVYQGYWATNQNMANLTGFVGAAPSYRSVENYYQGTLYFRDPLVGSAAEWNSTYTPYTYPHPLIGGVSPPIGTPVLSVR